MFQVFTTFMYAPTMNWLTRYNTELYDTIEETMKHISSYELDKCRIQYLSKNKKDVYIFSKMNHKKHSVLGYETNHSIVVVVEI